MSKSIHTKINNHAMKKLPRPIEFDIDCWENIFDNLSLRDILVMSQTCQQMCEIGGNYFRKYFRGTPCDIINNENFSIRWLKFTQTDFLRFVDTLNVYGRLLDNRNSFANVHLYRSLVKLNLCFVDLSENQIYGLQTILNTVECVEFYSCAIFDGFFDKFFDYCPKLKCLRVNRVVFKSPTASNALFLQKCCTLQYFQYISNNQMSHKNSALKTFLNRNLNIKYLEIDAEDLWLNRYSFVGLNLRLDYLAIKIRLDEISTVPFANLLKILHRFGFYKKFHLTVESLPNTFEYQEFINEMIKFDAFVQLNSISYVGLSRITQLKELHISGIRFADDMEVLAINLTKLKRLYVCGVRAEIILPFLRHTKTLETVLLISDLDYAIDVFTLNRECEKLARKVVIGVREHVYLATKQNSGVLNLRFVKIVREASIDFDHINRYLH